MKNSLMKLAGIAALMNAVPQELPASNDCKVEGSSNQEIKSSNEVVVSNLKANRAFDRQAVSAVSIKSVYNNLISMNHEARANMAELIRTDFAAFAQSHFELTRSEKICVERYWTAQADKDFIANIANFISKGEKIKYWNLDNCCPDNTPSVHFKYEHGTNGPNLDSEIIDIDFDAIDNKKRTVKAGYKDGPYLEIGITF